MENPIKKKIEELDLSLRAIAKILDVSQTTVHRHFHGRRRLNADNMEMYNVRLGIPLKDLKAWNKHLKEVGCNEQPGTNDMRYGPENNCENTISPRPDS